MPHSPTDPEPIDIIARRAARACPLASRWWLAWKDLNPGDQFEAGLIGAAYGRAQAPVDMRRDEA